MPAKSKERIIINHLPTLALPHRIKIAAEVLAKCRAADEQWGGPAHDDKHSPEDWYDYIGHQCERMAIGTITQLSAYPHSGDYRDRMLKLAGLAIDAVASLDRKAEAKAKAN